MVIMNTNRLQRSREAARNHRANIQKSLEHRIEVAKARGDEQLIRQLEVEARYYN